MLKLRKVSREEIEQEKRVKLLEAENYELRAKLDYVAMMTDVDIPTEEQEGENDL